VFRDWLPSVLQTVTPYVSSEDIDKGARWSTDIAKELEASAYGILLVTRENVNAPWLNFEAGALGKAIDKSRVSPFLFGIKRPEIKEGPILQFQSTLFEKQELVKLLNSVNRACEEQALEDSRLEKVFEVWWSSLETDLNKLLSEPEQEAKPPTEARNDAIGAYSDILEELLELVRSQQRLLNSPEDLLPRGYLSETLSRSGLSTPNPLAIKDLETYWSEFREMVAAHQESDSVPLPLLEDYIRKLSKPIDYLTTDASDFRRIRRTPVTARPPKEST
jgi:hypothetical protein